ncbi:MULTISPECIES: MurR/RpiR family transcriptional regulator [Inquilinus]|uniref:DNA-binding MurR/RpiR family transcriptional regulator n=1 Tax=Inquilinus ginsengisoli TaxID=363840 RepID=A0ABU1JLS3_9PROT|nr:MurR/RpiR family transcriptional regulator [Inquilinus ginsengisoli]MDR6289569.1 DNA-binding MurR/RpiR family transcriptional regulator [Inquilinus ginsengisoli]
MSIRRAPAPLPTIEHRIRAGLPELTPSERRAARAVLSAYPIAALETIAELADRAQASAPTILRWVSKLGYSGFPQFQRAVREEVQDRMKSPLSLFDTAPRIGAEDGGLLHGFFAAAAATLMETERMIDPATLDAVIDVLADPRRRILALGGRTSHIQAKYLVFHLHHLRAGVQELQAAAVPLYYQAADLGRRDVIVAFDYRRYERQTIALCRTAAKQGATVILVTDPWLSPIAEVAAHVLTAAIAVPSPFDTGVTGIALVEALLAGVLQRQGRDARERMQMLEDKAGEARDDFVADRKTTVLRPED